jgi:hypothetical protein
VQGALKFQARRRARARAFAFRSYGWTDRKLARKGVWGIGPAWSPSVYRRAIERSGRVTDRSETGALSVKPI